MSDSSVLLVAELHALVGREPELRELLAPLELQADVAPDGPAAEPFATPLILPFMPSAAPLEVPRPTVICVPPETIDTLMMRAPIVVTGGGGGGGVAPCLIGCFVTTTVVGGW